MRQNEILAEAERVLNGARIWDAVLHGGQTDKVLKSAMMSLSRSP